MEMVEIYLKKCKKIISLVLKHSIDSSFMMLLCWLTGDHWKATDRSHQGDLKI